MSAKWKEFRDSLKLTQEEENEISLEKDIINAIIDAREQHGLTQEQLAELCGMSQPAIARLEKAAHSPKLKSILKLLRPLGYRLAVVKDPEAKNVTIKRETLSTSNKAYSAIASEATIPYLNNKEVHN